jgi:hypothetical protein
MTSLAPPPSAAEHAARAAGPRPMDRARDQLRAVRKRARALLTAEGAFWTFATLGGLLLVEILADAALRLPAGVRWVVLALGTLAALAAAWRWVLPPWGFRPNLTRMALRLERVLPAESGLDGGLAAAIEFDHAPAADPITRVFADRAIKRASDAFGRVRSAPVLDARPFWRAFGVAAGVGVTGLVLTLANPEGASIGLARALTPWSDAEWPKRTQIEDATGRTVHASDVALPVRAALVRTNRPAGETRVDLVYRVSITNPQGRRTDGPERRVALTAQRRAVTFEGGDAELYERLIDPSVFTGSTGRPASGSVSITYTIETADDRSEPRTVRIVDPPELLSATAEVTPPAYARDAPSLTRGTLDLGRAEDGRAIIGPVLAGSRVRLTARYSTEVTLEPGARESLLADLRATDPEAALSVSEGTVNIDFAPASSARVPLEPVDAFGFVPRDEAALSLDVVPDRDPAPAIVEPARDEAVLATAVIPVRAEARDEIGLRAFTLEQRAARRSAQGPGAQLEIDPEPTRLADWAPGAEPATRAALSTELDLSVLALTPGDEVTLTASADDARAPDGGRATSTPRRLTIIDEAELVEQLRTRLEQVRRASARLDERQAEIARAMPEESPTPASIGRDQATLTDRLGEQRRAVEALADRQRRNALQDESLGGLLQDAERLLQEASAASASAAEAATADEGETAEDEQRRVRQSLERLLALLDRGEDGWLVRRSLERLLDDQRRLQSDTSRAGEGTAGRPAGELSPDERSELERIAERQRELAERAERAIDELSERSEALEGEDPGQSQALRSAASEGRSARVGQQLRDAAEAAQDNRTSDARRAQEEAAEAIEQMLEQLDQADRLRDRALQRVLGSLAERLAQLITAQRAELAALLATETGEGLDLAMINVNTRTIAVITEAATGPPETRRVADPLREAGEAQVEAIDRLREGPASFPQAEAAERTSLSHLEDSLDIAREELEAAEDRERRRVLAEIRAAYRTALEAQMLLRDESSGFAGRRLSRRDRAGVRSLSPRQTQIRDDLAGLLDANPQLVETPVVALVHEHLDRVTADAADRLARGEVDAALSPQDQAIELLRSLDEHLAGRSGNQPDDNFGDAGGGGGSGGAGGQSGQEDEQLVRIGAELRLLRDLQALTATLTRAAGEGGDRSAVDELGALQRRIAEQGVDLLQRLQSPEGPNEPPQPDRAEEETPEP